MIPLHSRAWWRATLALCLGSIIVFVNLYAPQPLLPALRELHGVSTLAAGLVMSAATLAVALALLGFGPLSDALGRGNIMRLTLLLGALASLGLALVPGFEGLLLLRVLQGLVLGGLPAVAIAWMGDEFEPRALSAAVGLYIGANTLGGIGGRLLGGAAGEWWGVEAAFLLIGALSLVGVALFWWLLPRARHFRPAPLAPRAIAAGLAAQLRHPPLLGAYLLGGLSFLVFINQYSYLTFRLSEAPHGLSSRWLGLLFLTYLGGTLGASLSGRITRRFAQPRVMATGIGLLMLGSLGTLSDSLAGILAALTLNAFGFFLAHATASAWVGLHAQAARGSASALYLVCYYLGASLGTLYLEPFWRLWQWPGVVVASLALLVVPLGIALALGRWQSAAAQAVQGSGRPPASLPQTSARRSSRPQADL